MILCPLIYTPFLQHCASMGERKKKWPYSFLFCSTSFSNESSPQGSTGARGTLPLCSDSGWCLPPEFNHFDTICKELSELKISFFFDSEAQYPLPADNERIELANGEISVVFMIKGLAGWRYGRDRFQKSGLWCRARGSFMGEMVLFGANLHGI